MKIPKKLEEVRYAKWNFFSDNFGSEQHIVKYLT